MPRFMSEIFTATHPNGGTMALVRENLLDKETDPFLKVTVYFPKTSPGRKRVSCKLQFCEGPDGERDEADAWSVHMEEMGWIFPKKFLNPLAGLHRGGWEE